MKTLNDFAALLQLNVAVGEAKLQKNVQFRLAAIGAGRTCTRCGGCGRYSFNGTHSICYKCNGVGKVVQRLTDKVYAEAEAQVASGELAKYLEYKQATKDVQRYQDELSYVVCGGDSVSLRFEYVDNRPTGELFDATRDLRAVDFSAARLAYAGVLKVTSRNATLEERKASWTAFLPLWHAFQQARQVLAAFALAHPAYNCYYTHCDAKNRAIADANPFALVDAMEQWEKDGRPVSVPYAKTL